MQHTVTNIPGDDFKVYEGDNTPEGYTCLVGQTMDGLWISLGTGVGTTSFDLESVGLMGARFIRILDDGDDQQNVADAGFDLDAIESLEGPTAIRISNMRSDLFTVHPNPANTTITIELQTKRVNSSFTIYNTYGQEMFTKTNVQ